ncbi:MAG: hypothetical protein Rpha_0930 [Candidatus Ruthia sp. Apha_13_S6]|nr:hypothetical protein [Candidatus Ruthia sp. Apha_13_S6]
MVIGGLAVESSKKKNSTTPGLGSVSFLGNLFQTKNESSGVSEFSLMANNNLIEFSPKIVVIFFVSLVVYISSSYYKNK